MKIENVMYIGREMSKGTSKKGKPYEIFKLLYAVPASIIERKSSESDWQGHFCDGIVKEVFIHNDTYNQINASLGDMVDIELKADPENPTRNIPSRVIVKTPHQKAA